MGVEREKKRRDWRKRTEGMKMGERERERERGS